MITGAMILEAETNTEWHRSQIQGFFYRAETSDRQQHVVRDLTKCEKQWLWSEEGSPSDYDATHERMMAAIERARADILAAEINQLAAQPQPA